MGEVEVTDAVNHPSHYRAGLGADAIEAIDVVEALGLGFNLGNAVKYIFRAGRKNAQTEAEDLAKAAWNLRRAAGLVLVHGRSSVFSDPIKKTNWHQLRSAAEVFELTPARTVGFWEIRQASELRQPTNAALEHAFLTAAEHLAADIALIKACAPVLTPMQAARQKDDALLEFIKSEIKNDRLAPSYREMAQALGATSPGRIGARLERLEARGLIRRNRTKKRAIEVLKSSK